ncbi:glycosyltransferase family 2 protein [Crateriforma conspicua]|uniref:Putative glycosyltransferase EpsE n=1 Tax=Crateriforma conspicua TaxID=2527996 RepID=A0A5C5Y5M7_9PLAN|nr:glycosyltransferase [Crateriforma conspicua]TWT70520.1 putative glycosyltransferase EpsE [Crateriforma conspicua]
MSTHNAPPVISIVIPVYNGEMHLESSINSIRGQSFKDFEVILIDDGSTDRSLEAAYKFTKSDHRFRVMANERNLGLPATLNRAFAHALGKYIARHDCDDIMLPDRLELQLQFMEQMPQIGLLGTAAIVINSAGRQIGKQQMPSSDAEIRWHEMTSRSSSFFHPSVIIRRKVVTENGIRFDESLRSAQDKRMWFEVLRYCRASNLTTPLIQYRRHESSISATQRSKQRENAENVCRSWIMHILGHDVDTSTFRSLLDWNTPARKDDLDAWRLVARLLDAMELRHETDPTEYRRLRTKICLRLLRYGTPTIAPKLLPREFRNHFLRLRMTDLFWYSQHALGC